MIQHETYNSNVLVYFAVYNIRFAILNLYLNIYASVFTSGLSTVLTEVSKACPPTPACSSFPPLFVAMSLTISPRQSAGSEEQVEGDRSGGYGGHWYSMNMLANHSLPELESPVSTTLVFLNSGNGSWNHCLSSGSQGFVI